MKKFQTALASILLLTSCDPDVPGERINLPEMKFDLKVKSDSAFIKLGDTITIYT